MRGFSGGSNGKESSCNAGDSSLILGLGRSPGEGKGYPLWYSGLENSMDCIIHGVAKSRTQLSNFHFHLHFIQSYVMGFPHSSVGKESACKAGDPGSIPGSGRSAEEGIGYSLHCSWASLVAQLVNNLPAMWETFPGLGRSPGEGKGYPL